MNQEPRSASSNPWSLASSGLVWVGGRDLVARRAVESCLPPVQRPPTGPLDAAFITPASLDEALYFAGKVAERMRPTGSVWIVVGAVDEAYGELEQLMRSNGWAPASSLELEPQLRCHGFVRGSTL
jgi:hypothetical protein